jgi:hypothetical protein
VVSTTPRPLYLRERPGTHCNGGWVGPRAGLDVYENSRPTGIRSPDCPARSQSLYRLSYPAHSNEWVLGINSSPLNLTTYLTATVEFKDEWIYTFTPHTHTHTHTSSYRAQGYIYMFTLTSRLPACDSIANCHFHSMNRISNQHCLSFSQTQSQHHPNQSLGISTSQHRAS